MNNNLFRDKQILFIGPVFYNYHNEIISELRNMGAIVDFYPEKPMYNLFILNYMFLFFKNYLVNRYLKKILKKIKNNYDYVFIIRGEIITEDFLKDLKNLNLNAKFIMYQWDSVTNNPNYKKLIKYFDKVVTFDMIDAKILNISYLPLFYTSKYENIKLKEIREYDIVFFGSYHGDRLNIIKEIVKESNKLNLNVKLHLFIPKVVLFKRLITLQIKFNDLKYLSTNVIKEENILDFYLNSKSVLDIENINQNGFTIRTFEVLGSGLKLITTNKNILNDKIYNKKDIYILDREKVILSLPFFDYPKEISNNYNSYSLNCWIKNVFN